MPEAVHPCSPAAALSSQVALRRQGRHRPRRTTPVRDCGGPGGRAPGVLVGVTGQTIERHGVRVLVLPETGPVIAGETDAMDVVGQAFGDGAEVVAVPVTRLAPDF